MRKLDNPLLEKIGIAAEQLDLDCFVVGGWVRDYILNTPSKDIDIVCVNRAANLHRPGIALAEHLSKTLSGSEVKIYKNYGTAQLKLDDTEIEFVGARKVSYPRGEAADIIENGSLLEDQIRRDFTMNSMAICLNPGPEKYGVLFDPFNGIEDLKHNIIRVVNSANTFIDDPLRIMRAIRFATKYGFVIERETFKLMQDYSEQLKSIARERINDELCKIMMQPIPSIGWCILDNTKILSIIFPELLKLKETDYVNGKGHKNIFAHSLQVLDNVASKSDNLWLRWAALLHDIGKPECKAWIEGAGWTFRDHNIIGAKMIPELFKKYKFPQNEKMDFVTKMVFLHMRPIHLVEEGVTDSAIRRMLFDAGDDIESLMILCDADVTSRNAAKVERIHNNYQLLKTRMVELEEQDRIRNFQPQLDGQEIMRIFNLTPGPKVGELKKKLKDAILDGVISNTKEESIEYLKKLNPYN